MKKLKNQFGELLSREQMKGITGGEDLHFCLCPQGPCPTVPAPVRSDCAIECLKWDENCERIAPEEPEL